MPISKVFAYNGLAVRVRCVDPAQLAWIEEFLVPAFSPVEAVAADCTVTFEIDARRYASVLRWGPHPDGLRVAGFAFDDGPVHMPVWDSRDKEFVNVSSGPQTSDIRLQEKPKNSGPRGLRSEARGRLFDKLEDRVIFDADSQVFYCVSQDGAYVHILSASTHRSRRISLMRVVRELAMSDSWTSRRFVLHAGACALADSGIVIAGPKGAGKTTLLMYVLGCPGARFIANDRVVVNCDEQQPVAVRGMPTVVSIREQTLRRFAAFEQRWSRSRYHERLALQEADAEGVTRRRTDPLTLTPAQFCALLGVPLGGQAPARLLLFPRLTDDIDGLRVEELSPESARQRLVASVFAAGSPRKTSQVLAVAGHCSQPDPAIVDGLSRALVEQVRSFDCQLGRPAAHTTDAVTDLLSQLLLPSPPTPSEQRF